VPSQQAQGPKFKSQYHEKNWQKDQWNRIENPETDPYLYGQVIFNKSTIKCKKANFSQQMILE
jgi:hypothetical protein